MLASLGRGGVAGLVERGCALAQRLGKGLHDAGYVVLNDVVLNQVLVDFGSTEATNAVIAAVQDDGTCWCGPTTWQSRRAMRISVSCWSTTTADVDRSLDAILALAAETSR